MIYLVMDTSTHNKNNNYGCVLCAFNSDYSPFIKWWSQQQSSPNLRLIVDVEARFIAISIQIKSNLANQPSVIQANSQLLGEIVSLYFIVESFNFVGEWTRLIIDKALFSMGSGFTAVSDTLPGIDCTNIEGERNVTFCYIRALTIL